AAVDLPGAGSHLGGGPRRGGAGDLARAWAADGPEPRGGGAGRRRGGEAGSLTPGRPPAPARAGRERDRGRGGPGPAGLSLPGRDRGAQRAAEPLRPGKPPGAGPAVRRTFAVPGVVIPGTRASRRPAAPPSPAR